MSDIVSQTLTEIVKNIKDKKLSSTEVIIELPVLTLKIKSSPSSY